MLTYKMVKKYIPVKSYLKEKNNGEFLIVSSNSLDIYYFNNTAKDLYELIDGKRTVEFIFNRFLSEYDVSEDVLQMDIINILRDFQWKNLILLKRGTDNEKI